MCNPHVEHTIPAHIVGYDSDYLIITKQNLEQVTLFFQRHGHTDVKIYPGDEVDCGLLGFAITRIISDAEGNEGISFSSCPTNDAFLDEFSKLFS